MRKLAATVLAMVATVTAWGAARADNSTSLHARIRSAIARVYPALVQIHVVENVYRDGREAWEEGVGSGVIISSDGCIVTNHHVAGNARRLRVRLADRREMDASLIGTDALSDISVIKLKPSASPFATAQFGDSDALQVGDPVLAMGCPLAQSQSVTLGIVSNTNMVVPSFFWPVTFKLDGEDVGTIVKWIGHDAQINPGNSGGPLVDLEGRVVGINEIQLGLSGAIPANLAKEVCAQLIAHGSVRRSWFGFTCQPSLDVGRGGALIAEIVPDSPADRAGMRVGDVLLTLGGEAVKVAYVEDLQALNRRMFAQAPGQAVPLVVERNHNRITFSVAPVEREPAQGRECESRPWGMCVRYLTGPLARELEKKDVRGVYVQSIAASGAAGNANPALQAGDIVRRVDGEPVNDLDDFLQHTDRLTRRGKLVPVLVEFDRQEQHMMTVVKLGETHQDAPPSEARKTWLPITWQVATADLTRALGLKDVRGVLVTSVYSKSAVDLQPGCIITKLDGQQIEASQPEDIAVFSEMIRAYRVGSRVELSVIFPRQRVARKVSVTLGAQPSVGRALRHYRDNTFDFEVREPGMLDEPRRPVTDPRGVRVTEVQPGGWAALAHLAVDDDILQVDGSPIRGLDDFEERMRAIAAARPRFSRFFVRRGPHTLFVELQPVWPGGPK